MPGKPAYLISMRLFISSVAATAGFDIEECEDIKTAVGEACKNVACHGRVGFAEKYQVICQVDKGYIEILIIDDCSSGCSSTSDCSQSEKPCLNCPTEGELSIIVIQSLMDTVDHGIDEQANKFIKMIKRAKNTERS